MLQFGFGGGGQRSRQRSPRPPYIQEGIHMSNSSASVPSGMPPMPTPFPVLVPQPAAQLSPLVVIKFFTELNPATAQQLMQTLDACVRQGVTDVLLLISSAGGSVHH